MIFTRRILGSERLSRKFRIVHVDVSDHRELGTVGRFDLTNIVLAMQHSARLAVVLWRERPAIVYLPLAQNMVGVGRDLLFVALSLLARARVIAHVHGGSFGSFLANAPRWFAAPALALLRRSAAFVVMTEWQRERVAAVLPAARVKVVPHGTPDVRGPARKLSDAPLRALYVSSHLDEGKGLSTLLDAAIHAQREGITTSWEIVGAWLSETVKRRSEVVVNGTPGISFRGALAREQALDAYASADVFVFPTQVAEGFGLVRIEAMAAGLPVITTEAGGAHEIVRDGVDGFIVGYRRADEIVARLRELRADPELRARMGEAARERQRAHFSEDAFEERLARVWREVVG